MLSKVRSVLPGALLSRRKLPAALLILVVLIVAGTVWRSPISRQLSLSFTERPRDFVELSFGSAPRLEEARGETLVEIVVSSHYEEPKTFFYSADLIDGTTTVDALRGRTGVLEPGQSEVVQATLKTGAQPSGPLKVVVTLPEQSLLIHASVESRESS
ncbi:hypothetical protein [Kineococcus radiotolerans]|uniref:Uncharacterized protein n=1 Tax=Kineococcus radiotolerans (strain ATCC BAA-149 / DSM 14245 / SRS30216) TaxID=266940 RepID=A6W6V7_KINRD|nr:hypothetical protein [Kineococcus radiotolerans]ABS02546.1 hypothetical protein Krad_1058 [Kineococcus radiotolerans SRS30216 = ATCC BAA-149]